MRNIEISETIDRALYEWYSERGLEVPNWRHKTDPDWWQEYLDKLDLDELDNQD